jgi:hypothetical protein
MYGILWSLPDYVIWHRAFSLELTDVSADPSASIFRLHNYTTMIIMGMQTSNLVLGFVLDLWF